MAKSKTVRADEMREGMRFMDGGKSVCVEQVSGNSLGDVVLRCSFSGPGEYPGLSLLKRPDERLTLA